MQYLGKANKAFAKGTPPEKKVFIRQFVAGITIFSDKGEGIVGSYAFSQIDEVSNKVGKSRASVMVLPKGGFAPLREISAEQRY